MMSAISSIDFAGRSRRKGWLSQRRESVEDTDARYWYICASCATHQSCKRTPGGYQVTPLKRRL